MTHCKIRLLAKIQHWIRTKLLYNIIYLEIFTRIIQTGIKKDTDSSLFYKFQFRIKKVYYQ